MKFTLVAVLASVCALALAGPAYDEQNVQGDDQHLYHYKVGGQDYLRQYKNVLDLFKYVHQPTYFKEHAAVAKDYSVQNHLHAYTNPQVVKEFLHLYHEGMLPKDAVFSVFYDYHLKQAVALFKLFYYAKDFETFYKTACWARYYMNQGLFLYSFSVALIHRPDTYKMVLPPIYEIYPYYFFNAEVIQKAQQYKQMYSTSEVQQHGYTIYANYSGHYLNVHPEQSMAYFTEDVGVNAYYYYYNLYRPFWMNAEEYGINTYQRGEEFYYFYQQFLARYYLERLSNGFGEINVYDYQDEFETGYHPTMCYQNGLHFPSRPNWAKFFMNFYNYGQSGSMKGQYPYSYYKVVDYERRIRDAIDAGFVYTEDGAKINLFEPQGFNTLGNIIESNPQSPNTRFYGYLQVFARHLLGYSFQPLHEYKVAPSALEHFETSLRDPAFWQLYKRIILYFQKYKYSLPHYTYDELVYPGVKVESFKVDRLVTYFENYDVDVTSAVYMNHEEFQHSNFEVRARQYRLNHKPFTYKINVVADKATQAVVRVFIGPKYDEYGRFIRIDENRMNFVEFDRFKYDLKSGQNTITRNSRQIFYGTDRTTYKQLYQHAMTGMNGGEFMTHGSEFYYAFPNRFLLPKGKHGGQVYQFYVIVSHYKAPAATKAHHQTYQKSFSGHENQYYKYPVVGLGVQYFDDYPLGYPFDRPIEEQYFYVPNAYFQDVVIYHEQRDYEINGSAFYGKANNQGYESQYGHEAQHYQGYESQHYQGYESEHQGYESQYDQSYGKQYNQGYESTYHHQGY